jgi:hypothetical protein
MSIVLLGIALVGVAVVLAYAQAQASPEAGSSDGSSAPMPDTSGDSSSTVTALPVWDPTQEAWTDPTSGSVYTDTSGNPYSDPTTPPDVGGATLDLGAGGSGDNLNLAPPEGGTDVTGMPVTLPGDNHDYDNEFLYAASTMTGDPGETLATTWNFALFLKCLAWREQGESWAWSCASHNHNPPVEDSVGLMQINTLVHRIAPDAYFDCAKNILAAAPIAWAAWTQGQGDPATAATIYNVGHDPGSPNQYGNDVAAQFGGLASELPTMG